MADLDDDVWMLCSACRKPIRFGSVHWVCSVSTCNRDRTRLVFCSVSCWDSHVATLRHRDAWAVEAQAPGRGQAERERRDEPSARPPAPAPRPPVTAPQPAPAAARPQAPAAAAAPRPAASVTAHAGGPALSSHYDHDDVLVVVSKVKKYIRDRGGMNTSDAVAEALGAHVRKVCDDAIRNAVRDGRKTVLDRDVPPAFPR
jgi:hypothetical protein